MNHTPPFRLIAATLLLTTLSLANPASAATRTWAGGSGPWGDPMRWIPQSVPGDGDTAVISGTEALTIGFSGVVSVENLVLDNPNATLRLGTDGGESQALLTVANGFENRGTIVLRTGLEGSIARLTVSAGTLTNAVGGVIREIEDTVGARSIFAELDNRGTIQVGGDLSLNGNVANSGTVNIPEGKALTIYNVITWTHRHGTITGAGTLSLAAGSTLILEDDFTPGGFLLSAPNLTINGPAKLLGPATGEFLIQDCTINAPMVVNGDMKISGSVAINSALSIAQGKTLRLGTGGNTGQALLTVANGFENRGTIELRTGLENSTVRLMVSAGTLTNAVGGVIRGIEDTVGARWLFADLDNRGTLHVEGELLLNGSLHNTATGVLSGSGTLNFASATVINDGTVAPGVSPGLLSIAGDFTWNASAMLDLELGGFVSGTEHDRLAVSGAASLNGAIRVSLINGFFPRKDDVFTVLDYGSRSGTFATLANPLPERIAYRVDYGSSSAQVVVLNTAPTLAVIPSQTVSEQTQLSVTATATDQDLPAQSLTYSLDNAPSGMAINPSSGQITWTPAEPQGPGIFNVTVRVTDNGTPALGHTTLFTVKVNEVNIEPQLVLPGAQTVNEQVELVFSISGTDPDLPENALIYELVSAPPGAAFDATTRQFRWTPTEVQGPGNFTATFRVTDNNPDAVNTQQLSVEGSVNILVTEVNLRPTLVAIGNQTLNEETPFSFKVSASDLDIPANSLTYSLTAGPVGMTIDQETGQLLWMPTEMQGPGDHDVTVQVVDNGSPALAHTISFRVIVNESNLPPVLADVTNGIVHAEVPFNTLLSASDADVPANALTYALVSGPQGASITPDGLLKWVPPFAATGTTLSFTVRVTDNGVPAKAADREFQVSVVGRLEILDVVRNEGQMEIRWRAIPGRSYRVVQSRVLPAEQWTVVGENVLATSETATVTRTIGAAAGGEFFQVELVDE